MYALLCLTNQPSCSVMQFSSFFITHIQDAYRKENVEETLWRIIKTENTRTTRKFTFPNFSFIANSCFGNASIYEDEDKHKNGAHQYFIGNIAKARMLLFLVLRFYVIKSSLWGSPSDLTWGYSYILETVGRNLVILYVLLSSLWIFKIFSW